MFHLDQTARSFAQYTAMSAGGSVAPDKMFNLDGMSAQLRSRYYCIRFQILRSYIYKALHFPDHITSEDLSSCGLAIQAACLVFLILMSMRKKKRLVPHHFTWTQTAMSVLIVLHMSEQDHKLRQISTEYVDSVLLKHAKDRMLDWLADMKEADGVAEWSFFMLERVLK